jgi:hypothetical protein
MMLCVNPRCAEGLRRGEKRVPPSLNSRYAGATGKDADAVDIARLADFAIARLDDGASGYVLENAFGQSIHVMPRPPAFRASLVFEWEGAMPDEIAALAERARALGIAIDRGL